MVGVEIGVSKGCRSSKFTLLSVKEGKTIKTRKSTVRLGSGSGAGGDRIDAALKLAEYGEIDYLIFDAQSEKAYSESALRKAKGDIGYDVTLGRTLRTVLPTCVKNGVKIIHNGGSADVEGAVKLAAEICDELNISGIKVAYTQPDSSADFIKEINPVTTETGEPVSTFGDRLVAAITYQGAPLIVEGLRRGANIVITSRAGDSTQFLAPLIFEMDWRLDDWDLMARGLSIGHLMECGAQLSGGYHADPGMKDVSGLDDIGMPIAEVQANGDAIITKVSNTGGVVSERTVKEQLLYELHDPSNYIHNDGVVDFTNTEIKQAGSNRVSVTGTRGHPRPSMVKVLLGVRENFVAVSRAYYGGTGAYARAKLAADTIAERATHVHGIDRSALRFDFVGVNALFPWPDIDLSAVKEVELRVSGYFETQEQAWEVLHDVESLALNGPAGVSQGLRLDYQAGPEQVIGLYTTLLPQEAVQFDVHEFVVE